MDLSLLESLHSLGSRPSGEAFCPSPDSYGAFFRNLTYWFQVLAIFRESTLKQFAYQALTLYVRLDMANTSEALEKTGPSISIPAFKNARSRMKRRFAKSGFMSCLGHA